MKRKKSFDNPCIFICCTLLPHFLPPMHVCMYVPACIKAPPSHSSLFQCPSYITLSLPPTSLPHNLPCHLPLFTVCQTALLPYLVFPFEVFPCITPPPASRNGRVTCLTRNTELCVATVPPNLFSYPPVCRIKNM